MDDHPVVRQGLSMVLCREPDLLVCGEAGDIAGTMRLVAAEHPDLVLVDLALDGEDGIELIGRIKTTGRGSRPSSTRCTMKRPMPAAALRAGAMGFVSKREEAPTIVAAIRHVLCGEVFLSPRMTINLLQRATVGKPLDHNPAEALSKREMQVFELLGLGMSMVEIARKLEVSPKTVESHRKVIKAKLNLPTAAQLSRRAFQWVQERS